MEIIIPCSFEVTLYLYLKKNIFNTTHLIEFSQILLHLSFNLLLLRLLFYFILFYFD